MIKGNIYKESEVASFDLVFIDILACFCQEVWQHSSSTLMNHFCCLSLSLCLFSHLHNLKQSHFIIFMSSLCL